MPLDVIRDHTGEERRLGYTAPDSSKKLMRASRTNIQTLRINNGLPPLIPKPEWVPVDYVAGFPLELITDQTQIGACTCFSETGSHNRMKYIRGQPWVPLSGFWLYDQINGGGDNGSNIIDSMHVSETKGVPPLSSYQKCIWKSGHDPSGVEWYKEDVAVTLASSDECATALLMGMFPQVPILVTNSFERFTGDGVAWGGQAPRGGNSNHSIYLAGLKMVAGEWHFILVNSWRSTWGPFKNGTCLIPLAAIDNPSEADDGYAHASTVNVSSSQGTMPEISQ